MPRKKPTPEATLEPSAETIERLLDKTVVSAIKGTSDSGRLFMALRANDNTELLWFEDKEPAIS